MALSQTGANYKNQSELQRRDRMLGEALDDLASQLQATRDQGAFGQSGAPTAPHPPTSIAVASSSGFATIALTHNNAPSGSQYVIEMATTPNFQSPSRIDNGISLSHPPLYLAGKTMYFRAAAKLPASGLSQWTYLGGQGKPTPIAFSTQGTAQNAAAAGLSVIGGGITEIQAGSATVNSGATITFPTPFTTALVAVVLGNYGGSANIASSSATGFVVNTSSNPQRIDWIAVGN
jgi:hypothetical protein